MNGNLPPLPQGFVLDQGAAGQLPPIPQGFVIDPPSDPPLSWSDVPGQAWQNLGPSAQQFASNIAQPFIHPVETARNLGRVSKGALEKAGILGGTQEIPYADAVGKFFIDRYGSMENLRHTMGTDPIGFLADLSTVLTAGGAMAAKAPGIIGDIGEAAAAAGDVINPAGVIGKAGKGLGFGASEFIGGLGTHTGGESLRTAARAGFEGGEAGKAFVEQMRGEAPMESVISDARAALAKMRQQRGAAYRAGMEGVTKDPAVLDFDKIDKAVDTAQAVKRYKGQIISKSTTGIADQIKDAVDIWRALDPQEFHTVEGMDALKQQIGDIKDTTQYGTPSRFAADRVYNAVRQTIADQAPEYAKVMKGYEQASDQIKEIEKTLSLNPNATIDTSLRKLQSILRNNVNTSYGRRAELAEYLKNAGAPLLMEKLTGQAMSSWTARGLGKLGMQLAAELAGGTALYGAGGLPAAANMAATLPFMSPRLMGEAAYAGGVGLRKLGSVLSGEQFDRVRQALAGSKPLASSLQKFEEAAATANKAPIAKNIGRLALAARGLSATLKDVGINLPPSKIMQISPDQQAQGDQNL